MRGVQHFLKEAFPLQKRHVFYGIGGGLGLCWGLWYFQGISQAVYALVVLSLAVFVDAKIHAWKNWKENRQKTRGWLAVGLLLGGIPYGYIASKSNMIRRRSSVLIASFALLVLAIHCVLVYLNQRWGQDSE